MNLGFLRQAVREGLRSIAPEREDPDLKIYNQLQPSDFKTLIAEYGTDSVLEYIKHMEAKRMKGKSNA